MTSTYQAGFNAAMTVAELKDHFSAKSAIVELNYESEDVWRRAYQGIGQRPGYGYARLTCNTCEYQFAGVTIRLKWDGIKRKPEPSGWAASHGVGMSTRPMTMTECRKQQQRLYTEAVNAARKEARPKTAMEVAIDETVADIKRAFDRLNKLKGADC